jgi:hypothetical protein
VDHLELVVEAAMAVRTVDMTPTDRVVATVLLVTTGNLIRLPPKDVLFQMKFVRDA